MSVKRQGDGDGATAHAPAMLLRAVLLGYSQGLVSSRSIERACRDNVLFVAVTGDSKPHFTNIAAFVSRSRDAIATVFAQVLAILGKEGLSGREMFAIDGVKLPSNASKHRSGTRAADPGMRQRDERYADQGKHTAKPDPLHDKSAKPRKSKVFVTSEFIVAEDRRHATCPAGQRLYRNGKDCTVGEYQAVRIRAPISACSGCALRAQCLRNP